MLENFRTPMPATSGSSVTISDPFTPVTYPYESRVTLQTMEKTIEIEKGFESRYLRTEVDGIDRISHSHSWNKTNDS